jgi:tRNA modification GTPase
LRKLAPETSETVVSSSRIGPLKFEAVLYSFPAGRSYTGDELCEVHVSCPLCAAEEIVESLCLIDGVRMAGPGEFTFRAFMNGKITLAQSEAVAEIVSGSNMFQVEAAQRLLRGSLAEKIDELKRKILELLSLFEAGMDFSEDEVIFISPDVALERTLEIISGLRELIESNIKYERMISLPSVALCGLPNAGKSSLVNALLGRERCIVSDIVATTRDILSDVLETGVGQCVLSDCAGIASDFESAPDNLASQAAAEYVRAADLVLFCMEAGKADYSQDLELFELVREKDVLCLLTKSDEQAESASLELFGCEFFAVSVRRPLSIDALRRKIGEKTATRSEAAEQVLAVNRRHYDSVNDCLKQTREACELFAAGDDELAALLLRQAHSSISDIDEQKQIDESILTNIFSSFCIGK